MLTNVAVTRYRCFNQIGLRNLRRINVLVGCNNAGKTSLLEAIELLQALGDDKCLYRIAQRRNEMRLRRRHPILSYQFHGLNTEAPKAFALSCDTDTDSTVVSGKIQRRDKRWLEVEGHNARFVMSLGLENEKPVPIWGVDLDADGSTDGAVTYVKASAKRTPITRKESPCRFVPSSGMSLRRMNLIWSESIVEEPLVVGALRTLDPNITSVRTNADLISPKILLGTQGSKRRHPVGTWGGGINRLLGLGLALFDCAQGVLLVDEIDTGLHYRALPDMWKFVEQLSGNLRVQVFATTHSLDCLRALAALIDEHPELATDIAVYQIDRRDSIAVRYAGEDWDAIVTDNIEVRG